MTLLWLVLWTAVLACHAAASDATTSATSSSSIEGTTIVGSVDARSKNPNHKNSRSSYLRFKATTTTTTTTTNIDAQRRRQRRYLQELFVIPISIQWRIGIGNGMEDADRKPTQAEYNGVVASTVQWLSQELAAYYDDEQTQQAEELVLFSFAQVDVELVQEATWDPSRSPPEAYPHEIPLDVWIYMEAATIEHVPSAQTLVQAINDHLDFPAFVQEYLWQAPPETSLFRFSQRVGYVLQDTGGGVRPWQDEPVLPLPSTPAPPTPAPTPGLVVVVPEGTETTTTTIPPAAGVMASPTTSFVLPMTMTIQLAIDRMDRQPTPEEYNGLWQVVQAWLRTDMVPHLYQDAINDGFVLIDMPVTELVVDSLVWDPTNNNNFPHTIPMELHAILQANDVSDLPSTDEFLNAWSNAMNLSRAMTIWSQSAQPLQSLFRQMQQLRIATTSNGMPRPLLDESNSNNMKNTYVVPFGIVVDLAVADDRQPTPEEYVGLLDAVHQWLLDPILPTLYADMDVPFQLSDVVVTLQEYRYDPTNNNALPHRIHINAAVLVQAEDRQNVPTVASLVPTLDENVGDMEQAAITWSQMVQPDDSPFRQLLTVLLTAAPTASSPSTPPPFPGMIIPDLVTPAPVVVTTAPSSMVTPAPTSMVTPAPLVTPAPTILAPPTTPAPVMTSPVMVPEPAPIGGEAMVEDATEPPVAAPTMTGPPPQDVDDKTVILATVTTRSKWRFSIGYAVPDRLPTALEYEGYRTVTEDWLRDIYTQQFPSDDDDNDDHRKLVQLVDLQTQLVDTSFDATVDTGSHTTVLDTTFTFRVQEDDQQGRIRLPSIQDLFRVMEEEDLFRYMIYYLHEVEPKLNVLVGIVRMAWEYDPDQAFSYWTTPFDGEPVVGEGEGSNNQAPVTTTYGGSADLTNLVSVKIIMQLEYSLGDATYGMDMNPSTAEQDGLKDATNLFLRDEFLTYYEQRDPDFVGIQRMTWRQFDYNSPSQPYIGTLEFYLSFMEGSTMMRNSEYWPIINQFDFGNYIRQYIWHADPRNSIFHFTTKVDWAFLSTYKSALYY